MSQSAYIKLVEGSEVSSISIDEVKEHLQNYKEQTSKTGQQLDWNYTDSAFPYTIETKPEGEGKWFYLKGTNSAYNHIIFGITNLVEEEEEKQAIQVVLPDDATHGDKGKANELCKYIAKRLKAELHLFNGRMMYFDARK